MLPVTSRGNRLRRLGWLVVIWAASVFALAIVAGVVRLLMSFSGLTV
ncbi:DUF2474 domain-containing protein [Rhizobium calliandrae]|uniref:DUF2474 domain-containing protein n=1 Tax=Rhizobium calliandrae TaxID=1312182 RepID=A0ABT7KR24_9HYPH|nr:DUF2474 domain-containing protein [Rhizobium calliandrae]MDL2409729.1 DUF2474 domain-containing protein [Rhizobium calliandrae]